MESTTVATIPPSDQVQHGDAGGSTLTRSDLLTIEPYKNTPYDTYKNAARRGAIDRVPDPRSPRFHLYVRESVDRFLQQKRKPHSRGRSTDESDKATGLPSLLMDEITSRYPDVRPYEITAWTNACPSLPHGRIRSWPVEGSRGRRYIAGDVELALKRKRAIKSGTPTQNPNLVYLARILKEFPELSPELLQWWRKTEKIHTEPCPLDSRKNLYDIEDVRRKLTEYAPAQTADRFEADGETWVFFGLLREKGKGVTQSTIRRWDKKGCPYLAGEKPVVLHFKDLGTGSPRGRHYVTQSFLDRAEKARTFTPDPAEPDGFISFAAAVAMGLTKGFVSRYAESNTKKSSHPARFTKGRSHPALGHPIRTRLLSRVRNKQTVYYVRYSEADCKEILHPKNAANDTLWATRRLGMKEYNIPNTVMWQYEHRGGPLLDGYYITVDYFPVKPTRSRPTIQKYYFREDLLKLSNALHHTLPTQQLSVPAHPNQKMFEEIHRHTSLIPRVSRTARATMKGVKRTEKNTKLLSTLNERLDSLPQYAVQLNREHENKGKDRGGRPRTKDRLHEAHLFAHRIAKEFKNEKASHGTSMKVFGARTRDLNQKFLGMKGMRRILAHVKRNPL